MWTTNRSQKGRIEALPFLLVCVAFNLGCGDGSNIVPTASIAPSKTTETVTGDNGSCSPVVCPASSPICPVGLHCFEGQCLDAQCKPACQYAGPSGGAGDAGDVAADVQDAGDSE